MHQSCRIGSCHPLDSHCAASGFVDIADELAVEHVPTADLAVFLVVVEWIEELASTGVVVGIGVGSDLAEVRLPALFPQGPSPSPKDCWGHGETQTQKAAVTTLYRLDS